MISTDIVVIGLTPSTIGLALVAKYHRLSLVIVDAQPLIHYPIDTPLGAYTRREPITVDVLTGSTNTELSAYRLTNFLGMYSGNTQPEDSEEFCTHKQFNAYLHFLLAQLEGSGYVQVIREDPKLISSKEVITLSDKRIRARYVVIGREFTQHTIPPSELSASTPQQTLNPFTDSLEAVEKGRVMVWGFSEYLALAAMYLADRGNQVTWVLDSPYKVSKFSLPSSREWGERSAMGDYYSRVITDVGLQDRYTKSVRDWQPSLPHTHYGIIDKHIQEGMLVTLYRSDTPLNKIREEASKSSHLITTGRREVELKDIPYIHKPLSHPLDSTIPLLNKDFSDSIGIYYTGYLTHRLDGPRQTTLIPSGSTAESLVSNTLGMTHDRQAHI